MIVLMNKPAQVKRVSLSFPDEKRTEAVRLVLEKKNSVNSVSSKLRISQRTIYFWIERYKKTSLKSKNSHKIKNQILRLIKKDPKIGASKLSLQIKQSRDMTANILSELGLSKREQREEYSRLIKPAGRIRDEIKSEIARKASKGTQTITELSKEYNIARKTIYDWIKRYKSDGIVLEKYVKNYDHPKAFTKEIENLILDRVVTYPELSIHRLAGYLRLSSHGVFNVLKKHNLTHLDARLVYSGAQKRTRFEISISTGIFGRVRSVWERFVTGLAPAPPPSYAEVPTGTPGVLQPKVPFGFAQIRSLTKPFIASFLVSSLTSLSFIYWIRILTSSGGSTVGLLFASIALLMGSFFFIYSMKYYLMLLFFLFPSRPMVQLA